MKDNQPGLRAAIADAFDDAGVSPRGRRLARAERRSATTTDKGHGRTDRRTITTTTAPTDGPTPYLDWPGVRQCFRLERERRRTAGGKVTTEAAFGITSLTRAAGRRPAAAPAGPRPLVGRGPVPREGRDVRGGRLPGPDGGPPRSCCRPCGTRP